MPKASNRGAAIRPARPQNAVDASAGRIAVRPKKANWVTGRTVEIKPRRHFHCYEAYQWHKLSLYLTLGHHFPEWATFEEINEVIAKAWESDPPPFACDR